MQQGPGTWEEENIYRMKQDALGPPGKTPPLNQYDLIKTYLQESKRRLNVSSRIILSLLLYSPTAPCGVQHIGTHHVFSSSCYCGSLVQQRPSSIAMGKYACRARKRSHAPRLQHAVLERTRSEKCGATTMEIIVEVYQKCESRVSGLRGLRKRVIYVVALCVNGAAGPRAVDVRPVNRAWYIAVAPPPSIKAHGMATSNDLRNKITNTIPYSVYQRFISAQHEGVREDAFFVGRACASSLYIRVETHRFASLYESATLGACEHIGNEKGFWDKRYVDPASSAM